MNILQQIIKSFYSFDEYPMLIKTKGFKVFFYIIILSLISISPIAGDIAKLYHQIGGINGATEKYVPDFEIKDNILITESKINYKSDNKAIAIVLDTQKQYNPKDYKDYLTHIFIGKEKFYVSKNSDTDEFDYTLFNGLTKEKLESKSFYIKQILGMSCIMMYFMYFWAQFFILLLYTALANIINIFVGAQIKFSESFKLVVYSRTMPLILSTVLLLVNISMPPLVYTGVISAYIYFGLKNIKEQNGIIIAVL